ncbi:MAG: type I methionyl aminopeptidase [Deltaproteobacteria bacterium]|nr:type I methionyl aminopeptidase [Deltaproteobacteria bacterium]
MIIKTSNEIMKMREAGLILWDVHQTAKRVVRDGVTTKEIDIAVEERISELGALPLFKGVPGKVPFPACACISVNEEVVHGIPSGRKISSGDIVSIDIGVKYNGFCADSAETIPVGGAPEAKMALLRATEDALRMAISMLAPGVNWNEISNRMQKRLESAGYSIVRELVGHGIGKEMWESPQIPNYYVRKEHSFIIKQGATLAIEPMVNMGKKEIKFGKDHWTISTKDGKPSAHFEHTVAVTENGPFVLTCGPDGEGWAMPDNAIFEL